MRTLFPTSGRTPVQGHESRQRGGHRGRRGQSRRETRRARRALAVALTVPVSLLASACGSSGGAATGTGTGGKPAAPHHDQLLAFSQCMRAHGVTNFPDPGAGGGIQIGQGSGLNPFSPAFKAAQSKCGKLLPGGGPGGGKPDPQARAQMLAISKCMRAHGVPDFPDPTTAPPNGPQGFSLVLGHGGFFLAVPSSIDVTSPAFKQASSTCQFGVPRGAKTQAP